MDVQVSGGAFMEIKRRVLFADEEEEAEIRRKQ